MIFERANVKEKKRIACLFLLVKSRLQDLKDESQVTSQDAHYVGNSPIW